MHDQAGRQLGVIPPRDRAGVVSYVIAMALWVALLFCSLSLLIGAFVILKALVEL
jgi:hypothetical protein